MGQHPAGHTVPSHCFLAAILVSSFLAETKGQLASVEAQFMLSAQQNQFSIGQHPAGHTVPSHCFLIAAILVNSFLAETNGQLASVEAQFMLSAQQNQFSMGQQPAGHTVPSHWAWACAARARMTKREIVFNIVELTDQLPC